MQKVTIKLSNVTIHTHGPRWEPAEWIGGKCIAPEVSDTVMIPPGQPNECTVEDARRLLRRHGGEIVSENPPQACLDAIAAYDAEQAAKYPACTLKPDNLARGAGRVTVSGERDGGRPW